MDVLYVHLVLNHFPIVGAIIGALLLAVAWLRRSDEIGKVSLGLFAVLGVISIAVFFSGEPAEEAVEHLAGFSKAVTERHEEAALVATIGMSMFGALALLALMVFRARALPRWVVTSAFAASLIASGVMGYVANLGGQIRHTEIRTGAVSEGSSDEERERR